LLKVNSIQILTPELIVSGEIFSSLKSRSINVLCFW